MTAVQTDAKLPPAVFWILAAGLLLRLSIAVVLQIHFASQGGPGVWAGTDEETFYKFGWQSAGILRDQGWKAFLNAPPSSQYFNWLQFKYTGLVLYLLGPTPLTLRLLSVGLAMAGIFLIVRALASRLERRALLLLAGLLAFFPSFAFWSALAIKEGMVLFWTGALCWGVARFWRRPTPWPVLLWAAAVCTVLGAFRIWAGVTFFLIVTAAALFAHAGRPRPSVVICSFAAILVALWFIPHIQLLICRNILMWPMPGDAAGYAPKLNVMQNAGMLEGKTYPVPVKLPMALVRPLPGIDHDSAMAVLAGLENPLFLLLLGLAILSFWRQHTALDWIWAGLAAATLLVAVLVGTNVGTIYRAKIASLPFVAYFAACPAASLPRRLGFSR